MIVGIPKEIKNNENRVSLTPAGEHTSWYREVTRCIYNTPQV